MTLTFFGQKITTTQIRFCIDRLLSRIDEWNNNEHIKMTILAIHCPEKLKICTTKNRIKDEHKKKHISDTYDPKSKT